MLDPACGSGNFLYLALLALKDIEHRIAIEAETVAGAREFPRIGPEAVKGIEINPYAAELARVTVWIGEIQWMRRNGFDVGRNPILKPLDTIECRDASLNEDGTKPNGQGQRDDQQPAVPRREDAADGARRRLRRPPIRGVRRARAGRGGSWVHVYWFAKAWERVATENAQRAGLVATNSIRGGCDIAACSLRSLAMASFTIPGMTSLGFSTVQPYVSLI